MARGKKTSNTKKVEVVKSYVETGSFKQTERETGVSDKTCKKIVEENPILYEQEKERFIQTTTKLINKALGKLDKKLDDDDNSLSNITTAIGTLYDKRALARGETTSNETVTIKMSEELKELSK